MSWFRPIFEYFRSTWHNLSWVLMFNSIQIYQWQCCIQIYRGKMEVLPEHPCENILDRRCFSMPFRRSTGGSKWKQVEWSNYSLPRADYHSSQNNMKKNHKRLLDKSHLQVQEEFRSSCFRKALLSIEFIFIGCNFSYHSGFLRKIFPCKWRNPEVYAYNQLGSKQYEKAHEVRLFILTFYFTLTVYLRHRFLITVYSIAR